MSIIIMLLDGVIYGILGWYVKNVFPSKLKEKFFFSYLLVFILLNFKVVLEQLNLGILFFYQNFGNKHFVSYFVMTALNLQMSI